VCITVLPVDSSYRLVLSTLIDLDLALVPNAYKCGDHRVPRMLHDFSMITEAEGNELKLTCPGIGRASKYIKNLLTLTKTLRHFAVALERQGGPLEVATPTDIASGFSKTPHFVRQF
jgi:hypothetical protein